VSPAARVVVNSPGQPARTRAAPIATFWPRSFSTHTSSSTQSPDDPFSRAKARIVSPNKTGLINDASSRPPSANRGPYRSARNPARNAQVCSPATIGAWYPAVRAACGSLWIFSRRGEPGRSGIAARNALAVCSSIRYGSDTNSARRCPLIAHPSDVILPFCRSTEVIACRVSSSSVATSRASYSSSK
jgi:hypothetical protein